jgi:hypothetical protein
MGGKYPHTNPSLLHFASPSYTFPPYLSSTYKISWTPAGIRLGHPTNMSSIPTADLFKTKIEKNYGMAL